MAHVDSRFLQCMLFVNETDLGKVIPLYHNLTSIFHFK